MDVVRRGIVILDLNRLARHNAENVRMVLASLLIEDDSIFGNIEGAIAQTVFHIHEDVREIAVVDYDGLSLIGPFASRVLAHINFRGLGCRTIELYCPIHGRDCCGIDGSSRGRRLSGLLRAVAGLFRVLFLTARPKR